MDAAAETRSRERAAAARAVLTEGRGRGPERVDVIAQTTAAVPHAFDDRTHGIAQLRPAALLRPRQRLPARARVELRPHQDLHSIIFSMGRTRMADAPTAFNFCKVSQKTDSWQTA